MKPSEIISLARRQTGCTEDIVTTDEAFRFLNFVIEDFGADIRASDSGHGFDYLEFDINAGQYTYAMDEDAGEWYNKFPIGKLEKVWYKMPDGKWRDLDVRFIDKIDINDFPNQGEPEICFLCNNTINLIPEPKTATKMMVWGYNYNWELFPQYRIVISGGGYTKEYIRTPDADEALTSEHPYAWQEEGTSTHRYTDIPTPAIGDYLYDEANNAQFQYPIIEVIDSEGEDAIFIPKRWHYILVEGLKYRMYGNMGVNFETARTNARAFYDNEKMKALQNIMDRGQESDEPYYPDLNFLNY